MSAVPLCPGIRVQWKTSYMLAADALFAEWKRCPAMYRNEQWFRGGLVFEAHRLVYHSA